MDIVLEIKDIAFLRIYGIDFMGEMKAFVLKMKNTFKRGFLVIYFLGIKRRLKIERHTFCSCIIFIVMAHLHTKQLLHVQK